MTSTDRYGAPGDQQDGVMLEDLRSPTALDARIFARGVPLGEVTEPATGGRDRRANADGREGPSPGRVRFRTSLGHLLRPRPAVETLRFDADNLGSDGNPVGSRDLPP